MLYKTGPTEERADKMRDRELTKPLETNEEGESGENNEIQKRFLN